MNKTIINNDTNNEIDLKELLIRYLTHWKLYIFFILLLFSLSLIYLSYKSETYNVSSSILIQENDKGDVSSEMSAFNDLGLGIGSNSSGIENVIELLKSRYIIQQVVKENKLHIKYYKKQGVKKIETFSNEKIVNLNLLSNKFEELEKSVSIIIKNIDKETFEYSTENEENIEAKFGEKLSIKDIGEVIITPLIGDIENEEELTIIVNNSINSVISIQSRLSIERVNNESNAVKLSFLCKNIELGKSILNKLINTYSLDEIDDKNKVAKNTILFINERIEFITKELSNIEGNVSSFKSQNEFFDLNDNANIFSENQSFNNKALFENETQLKLAQYIQKEIINKGPFELIPINIGVNDISVEKSIESINELLLERNKILSNSSIKNPVIINLDGQIKNLKSNLQNSLINIINSLIIKNSELKNLNLEFENRLNNAPKQEKDFREILRQQQVKETLYLYLLQKREETSISYAVKSSNTKVMDEAYSDKIPISPKKNIIYLAAILIGAIFPTLIIYLRELFDTKVKSKKEIIGLGLPYLGDIPNYKENSKIAVKQGDRSSTSEAFRMLKTNISFIKNEHKAVKTIFVTSTLSKEGKSFVSLNLAATYGLSGKKVLLIGLDLRAPKILEYLNINSNKGVSNFLINDEVSLDNYIMKLNEIENVSILPSGPIPPNPSELLNSNKVEELFKFASDNYDIVIVDTAPVGLVTDTMQIAQYADMFLYVVRANYLEKKLLQIGQTLYNEKKLNNMSMILNGSDLEKGYGYGYGYGEEEEKIAWWKKPFTKNK